MSGGMPKKSFRFVRNLYLCRELAAGIKLLLKDNSIISGVKYAINQDYIQSSPVWRDQTPIDANTALVATLVFEDLDRPDFTLPSRRIPQRHDTAHMTSPTSTDDDLVALVQYYVYGIGSSTLSLGQAMLSGSYQQAECIVSIFIAILLDAITTSTCFSLLNLASRCHCQPLYHASKIYAIQNFDESIEKDSYGLGCLKYVQLVEILGSHDVVLSSEYQVFRALSTWVEAEIQSREHLLVPLLKKCVRFDQLSMEELTQILDNSLLVSQNPAALELAALNVIQHYMSSTTVENKSRRNCGMFIKRERDRAGGTRQEKEREPYHFGRILQSLSENIDNASSEMRKFSEKQNNLHCTVDVVDGSIQVDIHR